MKDHEILHVIPVLPLPSSVSCRFSSQEGLQARLAVIARRVLPRELVATPDVNGTEVPLLIKVKN